MGYVSDAIHWFLHKVNVDLVDTLRAFKTAACLKCPARAMLASVHWPQQLQTFPFLNEDTMHHGWPVPGAAVLWHTLLVRKVFHSKLTAWQI